MSAWNKPFRFAALALTGLAGAVSLFGFVHLVNPNTGLPTKWPAGSIPFRIMLGEAQNLSDGTSFNTTAEAAANEWNRYIGDVQFQVTLAPAGTATEDNGANEMVFAANIFGRAFSPGIAAVTTRHGQGNRTIETDIIFNSARGWDSYRTTLRPEAIDLRRVALHELGHSLGLGHPDQAGQDATALMNSQAGFYELLPDDRSGAQALYGDRNPQPNDRFGTASMGMDPITSINSSGWVTHNGWNTKATKEPGEPNHAGNSGGRSVWWAVRVRSAGSITIDTKGSYFDTTLGIYTGTSVSSLTPFISDDDIEDGVIQASSVTFNVIPDTVYRIAVDGFNNDDGFGADSGGIKLNIAYHVTGDTAPVITTQPASTSVVSGTVVTFSTAFTGSSPFRIQWLFNGNPIAGADSRDYHVSATTATTGTYSVRVSNPVASVTSSAATLALTSSNPVAPPSSSGGGGGGGGGGAPSLWFGAALLALGAVRLGRLKAAV